MRRRAEHIFLWIKRTVPMLIAIGAVLSVILLFFPTLPWGRAALCAVLLLALSGSVATGIFYCKIKKNSPSEGERSAVERDRFLSDVAHELKTPLTVVRGCAEVMSDGAVPEKEFPEYCRRILRETDAMSRLVSDLLDVARLRAGRISFSLRDVELSYLGQSVCENLRTVSDPKGVRLEFESCGDPLPVLSMDYDRIRQLLVILLDNGIKHTPEGGCVTLSVGRFGDRVKIFVRDTGKGIDEADLPYVFERFYKADASRGGLAVGSGIGLSVAQQIVRLHGGTLSVSSQKGRGTCFTADLPLREYQNTEEE